MTEQTDTGAADPQATALLRSLPERCFAVATTRLGLRCPVLCTFGYTDQALTSGASRDAPLLRKPYHIGELATAVRAALDARARRGGTGHSPPGTPPAP